MLTRLKMRASSPKIFIKMSKMELRNKVSLKKKEIQLLPRNPRDLSRMVTRLELENSAEWLEERIRFHVNRDSRMVAARVMKKKCPYTNQRNSTKKLLPTTKECQ